MPAQSPKGKLSVFRRSLQRLAQATGKIQPSEINRLSKPSKADLADFRAEWPSVPLERKRAILKAMNTAAEESIHTDFSDLFIALLDDGDERVRALSVDGLWENETPAVARRLVRMLMEDGSSLARAAAAEGLGHFVQLAEEGRLPSPSLLTIVEALFTRYDDLSEDQDVRRRALESVSFASDERLHGAIERAYADDEQALRISAVFAMGRSLDTAWSNTVIQELGNDEPAMRYEAAYAAGELIVVEALPPLIELVGDADSQVRQAAVWALGQIGGREAQRTLEAILEGDDEALHEAAEDALAELEFLAGETPFNMFEFEIDEDSRHNGPAEEEHGDDEKDDER
ncbi:MAG: HEAT repeat domain-containing protein [Chloroflexi bacterium]|nr:HEAT repeat domain-containing protein [Chloroflexota bacterium]